jgi:glycosyltransferase involved in cell wall biosynthesis
MIILVKNISHINSIQPSLSGVLSIVLPVFNEELVIEETINRIFAIPNLINFEVIIVNDGSTDKTVDVLREIRKSKPIRIISLNKNSGHMNAIRVGMLASKGDYVATLDADLQDPPEYIPEMLNLLQIQNATIGNAGNLEKIDVVQTFRQTRETDKRTKKLTASIYYYLIAKITGIPVIPHAADFRIMTREVVDVLLDLNENQTVYRLLIPSLGFKIKAFPVERASRFAGRSKYTTRKMFTLALDSIIGFSFRPLRLMAYIGILASIGFFVASIFTFLVSIMGTTLPGWPSIALLMLSSNAFLFACFGILGEYVGRTYHLVQNRPNVPWKEL